MNWMICAIDRMLMTGLCIAKWITQKMNVNAPTIDSILGWAQDLRGERIIMGGKLIQDSDSLSQEFMSWFQLSMVISALTISLIDPIISHLPNVYSAKRSHGS